MVPGLAAVRALLRGALRAGQVVGGVDQCDVREGLREISDLPTEARVVLLCEKSDIVAQGQQALEQLAGLIDAPLQDVIIGQPKAAGQKGSLSGREAVKDLSGVVTHDETVNEKAVLDCRDRSDDARVGRRQKANERQQQ